MFRRYLNDILLETIYHAKYREAIVVTDVAIFPEYWQCSAKRYIVLVLRNIATAKTGKATADKMTAKPSANIIFKSR